MKKILFGFALIMLAGCQNSSTQTTDVAVGTGAEKLSLCLSEKGVKMYGTERCPHCQNQKKLFGENFKNVKFIDCDQQRTQCDMAKIEGYPTWVSLDGKKATGEQTFEQLANFAGCTLN